VAKLKDKFSAVLRKESECLNTLMGASNESLLPLNLIKPHTLEVGLTLSNLALSWFFNPKCILMHSFEHW
jgi:hypothetical protein